MTKKIIRALISVSDKSGLVDFAKGLVKHKVQILSTGGTAKILKQAGLAIMDVSQHTNFPEIMDGRVKTLHPSIHGGILADRNNPKHITTMKSHEISPIDMVVVNLYPFSDTVASDASVEECIENIDIGGPAMVRSAAKNHASITVVTDTNQYPDVLKEMNKNDGATSNKFRSQLALKAFSHTAEYDANISNWLSKQLGEEHPQTLFNVGTLKQVLRYGENPHQSASIYSTHSNQVSVSNSEQLQGKELSYNNLNDANVAFEMVCEFNKPACAIIKHANPCGIAIGKDSANAVTKALACDSQSAFGGILAFNCIVNIDTITVVDDLFLEIIIAPNFTEDALASLSVRQNLRLLKTNGLHTNQNNIIYTHLTGGILAQSMDNVTITKKDCMVVTKTKPTNQQWDDMLFAYSAVKHVKSNAIVFARNLQTVGIGAGQMSRVDSVSIAQQKSKRFLGTQDSVVASDAFFPFADALELCIKAGAKAIIQPGGSKNDQAIIEVANKAGVAMVFTGIRHFKH